VKSDKEHVHHALNGMTIREAFSIQRSQRAPVLCYSCVSYLFMVSRHLSLRIVPQNRCVTPGSSKFTLITRTVHIFVPYITFAGPSGRARGLRGGRSLAEFAGCNPAGAFECCVLSGRGLCGGPITRPEESYQVQCV
jgi:hypothetical protein